MSNDNEPCKVKEYEKKIQRALDHALKFRSLSKGAQQGVIEFPWYNVYNLALSGFLASTKSLTASPQWHVTFMDEDETGKETKSELIPDFTINSVNKEVTKICAVVEIKPHNDQVQNIIKRDIMGEIMRDDSPVHPAYIQVRNQAKHAFLQDEELSYVFGIIGIGQYWAYFKFVKENMSPVMGKRDPPYKPAMTKKEREDLKVFHSMTVGDTSGLVDIALSNGITGLSDVTLCTLIDKILDTFRLE